MATSADSAAPVEIAFYVAVSLVVLTYWYLNFNKSRPSESLSQLYHQIFKRAPQPSMQTSRPSIAHSTRHIWQYWDQTENQRDVLPSARIMMDSIQAANPDWEYHYVSRYNLWEFLEPGVDLPANFNDLQWSKIACKADVVRVALLAKYGGIYVDASVIALKNFNCLWTELEQSSELEYVGFENKAPVEKGFEYSVWFMMAKPHSRVMTAWHSRQLELLDRLVHTDDDGTLIIKHEHPMYLDFGHACLDLIIPRIQTDNPETMSLHTAIGCWSSRKEMGEVNWELYTRIVNDLLPSRPEDPALNHIHFYKERDDDAFPVFVKLHRANKHGGTYQDWLNKPGPWLDLLKARLMK